jgi:hypothetical protein
VRASGSVSRADGPARPRPVTAVAKRTSDGVRRCPPEEARHKASGTRRCAASTPVSRSPAYRLKESTVSRIPADGTCTVIIRPGLILIGFGAGFSFVSITTAAPAQVQADAAGLLSSAAQLGGAAGLAVIVAQATTRTATLLKTGSTMVAAQADGLRLGFLLASVLALAASLVAAIALQRAKTNAAIAPRATTVKNAGQPTGPDGRIPKENLDDHLNPDARPRPAIRPGTIARAAWRSCSRRPRPECPGSPCSPPSSAAPAHLVHRHVQPRVDELAIDDYVVFTRRASANSR